MTKISGRLLHVCEKSEKDKYRMEEAIIIEAASADTNY